MNPETFAKALKSSISFYEHTLTVAEWVDARTLVEDLLDSTEKGLVSQKQQVEVLLQLHKLLKCQ